MTAITKHTGRAAFVSSAPVRSRRACTRSKARPSRSCGTISSTATKFSRCSKKDCKAQFPGVKFVSWRDFGSTHGGEEKEALAALPQRFKELGVDAVISGMAC